MKIMRESVETVELTKIVLVFLYLFPSSHNCLQLLLFGLFSIQINCNIVFLIRHEFPTISTISQLN